MSAQRTGEAVGHAEGTQLGIAERVVFYRLDILWQLNVRQTAVLKGAVAYLRDALRQVDVFQRRAVLEHIITDAREAVGQLHMLQGAA